MIHKNK